MNARAKGRPTPGSSPRHVRKSIAKRKVDATNRVGVRNETCNGVFWPSIIYKEVKGEAPPRRQLIKRGGVAGVVLKSNAHPYVPDGCARIMTYDDRHVDDTQNLFAADSDDDSTAGKIADDLFEIGSSELAFTSVGRDIVHSHNKNTGKLNFVRLQSQANLTGSTSKGEGVFNGVWKKDDMICGNQHFK